jgi:DNA repair photolyase
MIGITERGDAALDKSWVSWVKDGKPAILITKDPSKLIDRLVQIKNPNVIVHTTVTGFGSTKLEPGVPHPDIALDHTKDLVDFLGRERVVLRIDPIIPTTKGIQTAIKTIHGWDYREPKDMRIRISFLDNYNHVKERFRENNIKQIPYDFHADLNVRRDTYEYLKQQTSKKIEICGEPGIECTGCISDLDCKILGVKPTTNQSKQRSACACLSLKHELLNNKKQCRHNCLYCYWW